MKTLVGKFTFTIPADYAGADAGKKVERAFEYQECETEAEALAVITDKKWSVVTIVNDVLKSNSRSNAYQRETLVYRPSEVSAEDIQERMVRDYIRLGIPEAMARAQVSSLLKAVPAPTPAAEVPAEPTTENAPAEQFQTFRGVS